MKKTERDSERFTRRVLDNLFAFVGLLELDGTLVEANRAPLEAAGIKLEDVVGKKFWDCYWWSYSEEIRAQLRDACARAALGEIVRYDVPVRMAADTRMMIDFQVAPLRDDEGKITHLIPSAVDITERTRSEQALRESERRWRQLADAMPQLVWMAGADGIPEYYNSRAAEYDGIKKRPDGRWKWEPVVHPDDLDKTIAAWHHAVETGLIYECEHRIRMADGTYRWHLSRAIPIHENDTTKWFGTGTDVHDLKMAQEALRQADRRKDEFLAMLAHELRNPLAPIRTAVEVLRLVGPKIPASDKAQGVIVRQVDHMVRLIDDLLDVSRIARGKIQLRIERCDLVQVVKQCAEDYRASLEAAGVSLSVFVPDEPLWTYGDRTRLVQSIGNLLHNATKFTNSGGRVTVRLEQEPAYSDQALKMVKLTIEDTGMGIEPALLPLIFDAFSQAEQGLARSKGGLGLGLALVKGLIELHGGSASAHSDGPGCGSRFTLQIPTTNASIDNRPSNGEGQKGGHHGLRILVIEDNRDAAESLEMLLSLSGNNVDVAFDGLSGIARAREMRPDVVLCDLGLPGDADGFTVARTLRADPSFASTYLVALSGYGQDEDRRRTREAGFDKHLVKPADDAALSATLSAARDRRQ